MTQDEYVLLPPDQEGVIFVLALYGALQPEQIRDYAQVRGRRLSSALAALQRRGLAWRGASGVWHTTDAGYKRGRP